MCPRVKPDYLKNDKSLMAASLTHLSLNFPSYESHSSNLSFYIITKA